MTGLRSEADAHPPRRHQPRRISVLMPVAGLVGLAVSGLLVLGLITVRVGLPAAMIGVVGAIVPVVVVVAAFLWIDRWEPEPASLLLLTFAWGACVATLSALLVNDTAAAAGDLLFGDGQGGKISALVSAPLVEEIVKAVPVLVVLRRRSHEFDGVVDGIVYAGVSAAGFAFTENIFYFGRAFVEHGLGDGTTSGVASAFILRGVLSPFAHPLFTVLTGIGIGFVAGVRARVPTILVPLAAYIAAVLLHALWNAAATLGGAATFLDVYFLIMVPIFSTVVLIMVWQRRREQRIIAAALPALAEAGWIARSEAPLLASLEGRRRWRRQARKESGRAAARAVMAYQAAVTELAFQRRWGEHGAADPDTAEGSTRDRARHDELLAVVRRTRTEAVRQARQDRSAAG